jgi:glucose uptake protein
MFVVHQAGLAILLCVVTMLCWGSWANTQKLAGKDKWAFPLFYWDYAVATVLTSLLFAHTLGSFGTAGMGARANLHQASLGAFGHAVFSGALFNLSNLLLVAAVDAAGLAVAFPVGVGLAMVIGTIASYIQEPKGNPALLFGGVALVVAGMVFSAVAGSRVPRAAGRGAARGVVFAILAGCLMGFFYPQLAASLSPNFSTAPIAAGMLTPYVAASLFACGLFVSCFLINTIAMKAAGAGFGDYFRGSLRLHSFGLLGGLIWMIGLSLNVIAAGTAGPAISYALGQGSTLVAGIWGVFVWKEFANCPPGTKPYIAAMFLAYMAGLAMIATASL